MLAQIGILAVIAIALILKSKTQENGQVILASLSDNSNSNYSETTVSQNRSTFSTADVEYMALTMYGEARGDGYYGMEAVGHVIFNRYKLAKAGKVTWWGNTIKDICLKKYQFSVWLENDPNYKKLNDLMYSNSDQDLNLARAIALNILNGTLRDITDGADHYHTVSINPSWAENADPIAYLGGHVFYRLEAKDYVMV